MSLICSLSNEVPEYPIVNRVSGHVYEKRLIEKYLTTSDCDPITGQKFSIDDLIEIKIPMHVKPKPPTATSIPALLKSLQDEYDAIVLHSFAQKQQTQTLKQELSHALYQYDASCRVITRLTKEVTAAREALSTLKPQAGLSHGAAAAAHGQVIAPPPPHEMELEVEAQLAHSVQEPVGMSADIEIQLQERSQALTAERKKRGKQMPEDLVKPSVMETFAVKSSQVGLHSASNPGIVALDVSKRDSNRIITGGNDKSAVVFNTASNQIVCVLKGHTKKVSCVVYHSSEELAITGSPDSTVRVWRIDDGGSMSHVIRAHTAAVTGLSLHATGQYVLSSGSDGYWAFSDVLTGRLVMRHQSINTKTDSVQSLACMKSHPDGLICATGTDDGEVSIWNLKEVKKVAFLPHTTNGSVRSVAFSENGFYLATGGSDGLIKLWDLRKVRDFKTLNPGDDRASYQINDLEFDNSGSYLGVAGTDVRVYLSKQWDKVVGFNEHVGLATGIRFGENANSIISSSIDRTVKLYGSN